MSDARSPRRYRARCLSFGAQSTAAAPIVELLDDVLITVVDGRIASVDDASALPATSDVVDLRPGLLLPGFIDSHIHFPQQDMIGSYGAQLMDWLERYAFPAEMAYADPAFSADAAERFLDRMLANGTTTAMVFATVHETSAEALFQAAARRRLRMIAGKVLMDRNAPDGLRDTDDGYAASAALIERWHGRDRLAYAVTPRFAITSTDAQLGAAKRLLEDYPGTYLHSHLSENPGEIQQTLALYPDAPNYLAVYDQFGLVNDRSHYAHGIHLSEPELELMHARQGTIAFCPTSNLFLGSGLLDIEALMRRGIPMSVATDVGGGTSFSQLRTLADGYKVAQLRGYSWHPFSAFYALTLGNAQALGLADRIGRIAPGYEADWVLLDGRSQPVLGERLARAETLEEELFAYQMLGDERAVSKTLILGTPLYERGDRVERVERTETHNA
ncbi:MAG: guanine deaminase [Pseudomonadota bacterium]